MFSLEQVFASAPHGASGSGSGSRFRAGDAFLFDAGFEVGQAIVLTESELKHESYQQLVARLRAHREIAARALPRKPELARQLRLLELLAFLLPLLLAMRKRMKIPDLRLLPPPLTGARSSHTFKLRCLLIQIVNIQPSASITVHIGVFITCPFQ